MTDDLFAAAAAPDDVLRPLAVRMRPETLDEVVGQQHVLGEGSPLRRLADPLSQGSLTAPSSIILFGPPGGGKALDSDHGTRIERRSGVNDPDGGKIHGPDYGLV